MSNLPIDARAILEYLNELGYRNISAEQLKEFMKGMQSQSEYTTKNCNATNNNKKSAAKNSQSQVKQYQQEKAKELPENKSLPAREPRDIRSKTPTPLRPRVIKSKRPLVNFRFYLDIRDQNLTRRIEEQIKFLGATQEFFFNPYVTHFITDKDVLPSKLITDSHQNKISNNNQCGYNSNNNNNDSRSCLESPKLERNNSNVKIKNGTITKTVQTRADAILSRARQGQTATAASKLVTANNSKPITTSAANDKLTALQRKETEIASSSYISWHTDYALRFFKKVQHELKAFLHPDCIQSKINNSDSTKSISSIGRSGEAIPLKGSFIKIESIKRNCRPYYQLFRKPSEWPKIELDSEDGAFRFLPKKLIPKTTTTDSVLLETPSIAMTRKSRSSQRGAPLPAVVQALRKTSNATNNLTSTPRAKTGNSSCRQVKESSEKQCGVCEICKIEYDTLTIHLKSKAHEYFAKNPHNFIALDTLIQSSADVNKFLNEDDMGNEEDAIDQLKEVDAEQLEELEKMDVDEEVPTNCIMNAASPVEDPLLLVDRPSPPLREKSKRSTKGKHSSEKFKFTHAVSTTNKLNPTKTPPKKQMSLELENTAEINVDTTPITINKSQKISNNPKANLSSPIRTLIPPSSMYKVVGTSEVETTPRRGRGNKATGMDSPSIIVKFKKVRQTELLRLNGEAEKFMFPKQDQKQRCVSSDLPTDMDRPSISSEQQLLHNNTTLSSSSLNSSIDIVEDNANGRKSNVPEGCDKKNTNKSIPKSFQNAPIQPERQLKKKTVGRKRLNKNDNNSLNELSPPSAAAAIVAATAKIKLPAATRKSSRTATAIVTAATTSSRLLRAAADAVKKSSNSHMLCQKTIQRAAEVNLITSPKKSSRLSASTSEIVEIPKVATSAKIENVQEESVENVTLTGGRIRQCRLAATAAVVKMEDRMGDSESEFNDTTDNDDDDDNDNEEMEDKSKKNEKNYNKSRKNNKVKIKNKYVRKNKEKLIDKDYKCKLNKNHWCRSIEHKNSKIKINLSVKYKCGRQRKRKQFKLKKICQSEQTKLPIKQIKNTLIQKRSKSNIQMYDYKSSERLQQHNYSFERLPTTDLWYRVFNRQDACEERYFEYYGSTDYRKLPYELGPIPFFQNDLSKNKCILCNCVATAAPADKVNEQNEELPHRKLEKELELKKDNVTISANPVKSTMAEKLVIEKSTYAHKHKKMHLLQRYRQEQEALQQEELKNKSLKIEEASNSTCIESESWTNATPNMSKENSPERVLHNIHNRNINEQRKRARSVSALSTTSSCASSHATTDTTLTANTMAKKVYRNKLLQKVAVLNFELPPRKSPREHASTLAFVSGIIKQRQESKPNSDVDEACTASSTPTTTENAPILSEEPKPPAQPPSQSPLTSIILETISTDEPCSIGLNRRSSIATPTEEICFATEISENVKRMRRGRNKYDHSPPYVASNKPRRIAASKYAKIAAFKPQKQVKLTPKRRYTYKAVTTAARTKSRLQANEIENLCLSNNKNYNKNYVNLPGIRKTGQKKGVLEFEVDNMALQALDKATLYNDVKTLENQIDNFLETSGIDMDMDGDIKDMFSVENADVIENPNNGKKNNKETNVMNLPVQDYFSSDIDLCDLINISKSTSAGGSANEDTGKSNNLSLFNAVALNTYFRKRKYMKSNRTGWPKLQKKKYAMRHQKIKEKHSFNMSETRSPDNEKECITSVDTMTPPNSEYDLTITNGEQMKGVVEDDEKNMPCTVDDNVRNNESDHLTENDEENETILNINEVKVEDDEERDYEGSSEEADDEDEFHDAELEEDDTTDFTALQKNEFNNVDHDEITEKDHYKTKEIISKNLPDGINEIAERNEIMNYDVAKSGTNGGCDTKRKCSRFNSRLGKALANCFSSPAITTTTTSRDIEADDSQEDNTNLVATTSTPSSHMLRGLRRTPQLNGSLLSCNSPSEKAGDNSDIFTVSSDGLDTDLDLSNPPAQSKLLEEESFQHRSFNNKRKAGTSKTINKYNMSTKYVPNPAVNSCAAEAVTAAAKTLAIAQFLKKEVRVTCRRIRAPFRRFRYRR